MVIPFTKASACGNDFLIIDGPLVSSDLAEFTRRICDRHNGVGADGVEWLFPCVDAEIEARLINAEMSITPRSFGSSSISPDAIALPTWSAQSSRMRSVRASIGFPFASESPSASFSPSAGTVNDTYTLSASGFAPNTTLQVTLTRPDGVTEHYSITTGDAGTGSYTWARMTSM